MNSRHGNRDPSRRAKRIIDQLTGQPRHFNAEEIIGSPDLAEQLRIAKQQMEAMGKNIPRPPRRFDKEE